MNVNKIFHSNLLHCLHGEVFHKKITFQSPKKAASILAFSRDKIQLREIVFTKRIYFNSMEKLFIKKSILRKVCRLLMRSLQ